MDKRTVIITGGAQGIGKIAARYFIQSGYNIAVLDIDEAALSETEQEFNHSSSLFFFVDISNENQVKSAFKKVITQYGKIDVLINNAAVEINNPVEKLSLEEWNKVIATNLTGAFICSKFAIPFLRLYKGCIINISSTRAFMSEKNTEAYSASKGGILALTHAMAISLGPEIRVNCISPGWIDVSEHKKVSIRKKLMLSEADHSQHPAGRVGEADDIVKMMLFLADPANSFITGQNFIIDGGMTKKMIYI